MINAIRNYILSVEIPAMGDQEHPLADGDEEDIYGSVMGIGVSTCATEDVFSTSTFESKLRSTDSGIIAQQEPVVSAPTVTPSNSAAPLSQLGAGEPPSEAATQPVGNPSTSAQESKPLLGSPSKASIAPAEHDAPALQATESVDSGVPAATQPATSTANETVPVCPPGPVSLSLSGSEVGTAATPLALVQSQSGTLQSTSTNAKSQARMQYNFGVLRQLQTIFAHLLSSRLQYYVPRGFWKHFR